MRYFKKIEGGPFGDFEKFSKKMRIFNSLIVPKNLKEETLWNFQRSFCCKISKKMKGGPFGDIKKFSKISIKKPKRGEGESHVVEKSENLLVRKFCEKN